MYSLSVLFLQEEEDCPLCVCSWITKHIKKIFPSPCPISTLHTTGTNLSALSVQPLFTDSRTKLLLRSTSQDHDVVALSEGDISFQSLWPHTKNSLLEWNQQWFQGIWLRCRRPPLSNTQLLTSQLFLSVLNLVSNSFKDICWVDKCGSSSSVRALYPDIPAS